MNNFEMPTSSPEAGSKLCGTNDLEPGGVGEGGDGDAWHSLAIQDDLLNYYLGELTKGLSSESG